MISILIDLEGNIVQGYLRPSIEVPFHTEIYKARPEVNAVCHTHNPYTQGFILSARLKYLGDGVSTLSESPLIKFPETLGNFPLIIQYQQLGSRSLGYAVATVCRNNLAYPSGIIILLNHGVIGIGECIHERTHGSVNHVRKLKCQPCMEAAHLHIRFLKSNVFEQDFSFRLKLTKIYLKENFRKPILHPITSNICSMSDRHLLVVLRRIVRVSACLRDY